jgi:hypothetical protein
VYVGFDDGERTVAIALDAAGLGGLRDDRDGAEALRAACEALATWTSGAITIGWPHRHEAFLPNLAPGGPRFREEGATDEIALHPTTIGVLPLPSRTLRAALGWFLVDGAPSSACPVAGDRVVVTELHDEHDFLHVWLLRVPGATPVRWGEASFEDNDAVGDGGAGLDIDLDTVPDAGAGFATTTAGAPLLCLGPECSGAHGFVGLDADGRATTLVLIG